MHCYHQNSEMIYGTKYCSNNLSIFDDDKTMYFDERILQGYINQGIRVSLEILPLR